MAYGPMQPSLFHGSCRMQVNVLTRLGETTARNKHLRKARASPERRLMGELNGMTTVRQLVGIAGNKVFREVFTIKGLEVDS